LKYARRPAPSCVPAYGQIKVTQRK
jgi:hypothetical protein